MTHNSSSRLLTYFLPLLVFITPLLFLPFLPNFFITAKHALLAYSAVVVLLFTGLSVVRSRTISLPSAGFLTPLFFLFLLLVLNVVIHPEGRPEALVGRSSLYFLSGILAYFAAASANTSGKKLFLLAFLSSTTILALHSLLQLTWLSGASFLPTYMQTKSFTLTGSPLTTLILLVIGLSTAFYYASTSLKGITQYLCYFSATVSTIAAVAYLSLMLPGGELAPAILPYSAAWALALEAFKSPLNLLTGVGMNGFTSLFSLAKPLSLNTGFFWNTPPSSAGSEILHLAITGGVLLPLLLTLSALRSLRSRVEDGAGRTLKFVLGLSLLAFLLAPASPSILLLFFLAWGYLQPENHLKSLGAPAHVIIASFLGLLAILIGYFTSITLLAENHLFRAQLALAKNDGRAVYEEQLAAVRLLPGLASYRLGYSRVNLSLASALSEKADLTEEERQQVATLVSQAVREGKTAATLLPSDSRTWQNLGFLYRNLINVAEGADQFAVSAYAQAVTLDPANAALRVDFGGLLYQLSQQEGISEEEKVARLTRAVQEFTTAVQLKPDYANAYYNLSKALESGGNIAGAYQAMQQAVASLNPTSVDLATATSELEALKAKLPAPTPAPSASPVPSASPESTDLSEPSPLPSPLPGGEIELPEESPQP